MSMLFFFLVTLCGVFGEEDTETEALVTLTDANFTDFTSTHSKFLLEFYAPWCGHCKALAPEYEAAAQELKRQNSPIKLVKVDATANPETIKPFNIEGYPTILFMEKGKSPFTYNQERKSSDIVKYIKSREKDAFQLWTKEKFEQAKQENYINDPENMYMVFAFVRKNSKREKLYEAFCENIRGKTEGLSMYKIYIAKPEKYHVIVWRNNRTLFENENLDGDYIISFNGRIFPKKSDGRFEITEMDLGHWLYLHRFPFFINGDDTSIMKHPGQLIDQSQKTPRKGIIMIRTPNDLDAFKQNTIELVKRLRIDGYYLVYLTKDMPSVDFMEGTNMMVLAKDVQKVPKFKNPNYDPNASGGNVKEWVQEQEQLRLLKYKDSNEVNVESFKEFIKKFEDGKIERFIKSKVIEQEHETIVELNGNNFNEIVLDKNMDVLVLYYAQWNEHSKTYMKEYFKVGDHVQKYYNKKENKILVARIDLDGNDVDELRLMGVPSLIFYPAGSDKLEDGIILTVRDLDDVVEFIDENAKVLNKKEL